MFLFVVVPVFVCARLTIISSPTNHPIATNTTTIKLAFSSVSISLRHYLDDAAAGGAWRVHHGVIQKMPGSAPNDPATFSLVDHIAMPLAAGGGGGAAGGGG